jgi:hypothetical protein
MSEKLRRERSALLSMDSLILDYADRLARAHTHRELHLRAQRLRRLLFDDVALIVVAKFENPGRRLDAAAIPLA